MLKRYDPDSTPNPGTWLETDEDERLRLIIKGHRRLRVDLPNEEAHASFHLIVENQIAMGEETPVAATLQRLMREGLTRHDAVHAVASVLTEHIHGLLGGKQGATGDPNTPYYRDLRRLTARSWRKKYS